MWRKDSWLGRISAAFCYSSSTMLAWVAGAILCKNKIKKTGLSASCYLCCGGRWLLGCLLGLLDLLGSPTTHKYTVRRATRSNLHDHKYITLRKYSLMHHCIDLTNATGTMIFYIVVVCMNTVWYIQNTYFELYIPIIYICNTSDCRRVWRPTNGKLSMRTSRASTMITSWSMAAGLAWALLLRL